MSKFDKLIVTFRKSRQEFEFDELVKLLEQLGFKVRVKGSHHIFTKDGVNEIINL